MRNEEENKNTTSDIIDIAGDAIEVVIDVASDVGSGLIDVLTGILD